jgi:hypothetical protein
MQKRSRNWKFIHANTSYLVIHKKKHAIERAAKWILLRPVRLYGNWEVKN